MKFVLNSWCAACLLLSFACAGKKPTEILVVIDADAEMRGVITRVDFSYGRAGAVNTTPQITIDSSSFPLTFALIHDGGTLGPIEISAAARNGGAVVLRREASTFFAEGKIRVLRLDFYSECLPRQPACEAERKTCGVQGCVTAMEAGADSSEWTGQVEPLPTFVGHPPLDGGVDASIDMRLDSGDGPAPPIAADAAVVPDVHPDMAIDMSIDVVPALDRDLGGCLATPHNTWVADISQLGVVPNTSDMYLESMGASTAHLALDVGGAPEAGFPWVAVPELQKPVPLTFANSVVPQGQGPWPLDSALIRTSGKQVIVVQRVTCLLYEGSDCLLGNGNWSCSNGGLWDLKRYASHGGKIQSADPSGLPILPFLLRIDDLKRSQVDHALRVTAPQVQAGYVAPATAYNPSDTTNVAFPPLGARLRLRQGSLNVAGYLPDVQKVLVALAKYGMVVSAHGNAFAIAGETGDWDPAFLAQLATIPATAFEFVQHGPIAR